MGKKKGWMIVFLCFIFMLPFMVSNSGWALIVVKEIPGLELGGYIRNQTDIRVYSPRDIMRCDTNAALRADYKPTPFLQFYLELRPFIDTAYDLSGSLSKENRGVMGISHDDYSWHASPPHAISPYYGTDTEVGGWVRQHDVLSTNVNTSYWRKMSLLREAWFLWKTGPWQIKIGKQIVTWGETDGLKLMDMINATDYRHFIIDDMEDSKIPEFMANITYYFNQNWNLQFLWIPWYVENFQAPAGSAWALNGVNLIYFYDHFDALNLANGQDPSVSSLPYWMRREIARDACTIHYGEPDNENEFATRLKGALGSHTEFTLNYFYTHQKNNVFIRTYWLENPWLQGGATDVFQFYTKPQVQRIYGFTFNHVFGNFLNLMRDLVMRGEFAYYYKTEFFGTYHPFDYTSEIGPAYLGLSPGGDLFITKRDLLRACIGWDKNVYWMGLNWLVSLQTFYERIIGYPYSQKGRPSYISNVGLTKAYQDEITWTFYFNTDIMNERIKFDNLFVWNQMQEDGWNRFKVGFDISNHWSLWIGNNFFWGNDKSSEINPFVGNALWNGYNPASVTGPLNPDATRIGNIRRGDPLGEMSRNTSFFMELKYLF